MEKGNKAADNVSCTLLNTVEGQTGWIREVMIGRARRLAECGLTDITFMVIGQGIETMGAFLDKKPFRAKGQAASRFSVALDELFPPRYSALNGRGFLFANLRSSLTHLSVGSPHLVLAHTCDKAVHLSVKNKKTTLVLENLMDDYVAAWEKIIDRLAGGTLRIKPLAAASSAD
ncbi:MAG: hypothetical protein IJ382_02875 [Flavobacteriales bacterium]|nr:hypothetical protein [Flavobacteriales bacterium]PWM10445.1 MAG: hypothetical protein DBY00_06035 [Flavobacteriales bacterium]